jgi:hypothetical protein
MVKVPLLFVIGIFMSTGLQAQESKWLLGTGITYCSYVQNPGVNLNITYRVFANLHIGPDFSAILNKEVTENGVKIIRKELEYNFNGQYLFDISEKVALYPLVGINFSKITIHPENETADKRLVTALNTGGGIEIKIKRVRLFFESKFVTKFPKYDLTTGVLFQL